MRTFRLKTSTMKDNRVAQRNCRYVMVLHLRRKERTRQIIPNKWYEIYVSHGGNKRNQHSVRRFRHKCQTHIFTLYEEVVANHSSGNAGSLIWVSSGDEDDDHALPVAPAAAAGAGRAPVDPVELARGETDRTELLFVRKSLAGSFVRSSRWKGEGSMPGRRRH